MLNKGKCIFRQKCTLDQEIPITNYELPLRTYGNPETLCGNVPRCEEKFGTVIFPGIYIFPKNDINNDYSFINLQKVTIRVADTMIDQTLFWACRKKFQYLTQIQSLQNSIKIFILTEQRSYNFWHGAGSLGSYQKKWLPQKKKHFHFSLLFIGYAVKIL